MFGNALETQTQLPEDLASQERLVRRNVEALGAEVERLTGECDRLLKEGEQAKETLAGNTKLLAEKQEEIASVEAMLATLKGEYEQKESEAKTAFDLESALFGKGIIAFNSELEKLREEIAKHEGLKRQLLSDSEALSAKLQEKQGQLASLKAGMTTAQKELKAVQVEIEDSKALLAKQSALKTGIAVLESESKDLTKTKQGLEKTISTLQKSIVTLEAQKQKATDELKAQTEEHEKEKAEQRLELEAREGVVSDREAWLKTKEATLREVKQDLEIFYGRKINLTI